MLTGGAYIWTDVWKVTKQGGGRGGGRATAHVKTKRKNRPERTCADRQLPPETDKKPHPGHAAREGTRLRQGLAMRYVSSCIF